MKFCSNCGHGSEEGKKFCAKCGNSLQSGAEQTTAREQQMPQGGYQQAPQAPQGGYQQVPVKKKKSPLLTMGLVGIFACGALGATYLWGGGNEGQGGIMSVFQDLEPFPYDLDPLLDQDALMTALEEQDYYEEWMEEFEEIPEDYYYDLAIGAGSIVAVYLATNFDAVVDEMVNLPVDLDISTAILDELYDFSDEIWQYIPAELETMTITWDTSVRAKSGEIPFTLVVNGDEFVPDPDIDEEDLEELIFEGDPSDWSLDEMLDLLSLYYFEAEEELEYLVEYDYDNEIFDYLYASTSWAKMEPFVLEIERTSSREFDVYTSSAHWAQLGFSYKNGKVSERMDVAPLVAGVVAPQYLRFVESSREQMDMTQANQLCKAMTIALAVTEGDHSDVEISWSQSGLVYSNPNSTFAKEVQATLGNYEGYVSDFGKKNPVTFLVGNSKGMYYVYVDKNSDYRWAEGLNLSWGPED